MTGTVKQTETKDSRSQTSITTLGALQNYSAGLRKPVRHKHKNTEQILGFCTEDKVQIARKVPFNPKVTKEMVNGKTIAEYAPENNVAKEIGNIWKKPVLFKLL